MALAEGAAAAVLAGQAIAGAAGEQAAERERLAGRPVEARAVREHLALGVEDALQRAVRGEAFGDRRQDLAKLAEFRYVDGRRRVAAAEHRFVGPSKPSPAPFEPVRLVRQIREGRFE